MIIADKSTIKKILCNLDFDNYQELYVYNSEKKYYNLTEIFVLMWHNVIYGLIDWEKYWEKSFKADDKMHGNASNFNQV